MSQKRALRIATVALIASVLLIAATTASASRQAVVRITYKQQWILGTTFQMHENGVYGSKTVTVATPTPTPSIMWAAGLLSQYPAYTRTYTGPYTLFAQITETFSMKAGTLEKSHPGAAPTGGSIVGPTTATATTLCFVSNPPLVMPGPPALPGQCFPKLGYDVRLPGSKRYGGSARLLKQRSIVGTSVNFVPGTGLDNFSIYRAFTSRLTGPDTLPPKSGIYGGGQYTATALQTTRRQQQHERNAPFTTGIVQAGGTPNVQFYTNFTATGVHDFNTTNLTGQISMVKPFIRNSFLRNNAGAFGGRTTTTNSVRRLEFTFAGEVPEPGTLLLLGAGALGLLGLARVRRADQDR